MKCFFKKANALDFFGYPTLDGLVNLYTENMSDHHYFMAVLKITNFCLKGVNIKYKINQRTGMYELRMKVLIGNVNNSLSYCRNCTHRKLQCCL